MKENAPEWPYILIGTIAATIDGCIQPAYAFIFAEIIAVSHRVKDLSEYSARFVEVVGGLTPSGFSQERPINTQMRKFNYGSYRTIPTKFQEVQGKYNFDHSSPSGLITNRLL